MCQHRGALTETKEPTVDDRTDRAAARWLARHGLAGAGPDRPTPLLAARLAARLDSADAYRRTGTVRLAGYAALVLAALLAHWLWQRVLRAADRRAGAGLATRVAHPAPPGWRTVLGRRCLALAAAMNAGALGLAAATAALAHPGADRTAAVLVLVAIAALDGLVALDVADIVRRPALAADALSLRVDDVLRAEDARTVAVSIQPAALAVFAVLSLTPDVTSALIGWCYALIGCTFVAGAFGRTVPAPVTAPATTP
jgi:hypothetical protein